MDTQSDEMTTGLAGVRVRVRLVGVSYLPR